MDPVVAPERGYDQFLAPNSPTTQDTPHIPTEIPTPTITPMGGVSYDQYVVKQPKPITVKQEPKSRTLEDVQNDPESVAKIREMMVRTKDVSYEDAAPDELIKDFMAHMRFLNTNELSISKELFDIYVADDETKAVYGEAYKVYENMGSMFQNGDFWGGSLDYAQAVVTSPSTYLGLGLGRIVGQAGTKAASKKIVTSAINAIAKQAVKKSKGRITEHVAKNQLRTEAAKVTARNAIIGTTAVESSFAAFTDMAYQEVMMETGVQEDYSLAQTALAAILGSVGAIAPTYVLIKSSKSTLGNASSMIEKSYTVRAKKAAKTALPEVASSFKKANADWAELSKQGLTFKDNYTLQKSVAQWFFDPKKEDSFISILQKSGVDLDTESSGGFARSIADYAAGLDDDVLEAYNKIFEPMDIKFGEALSIMVKFASGAGQDFNLMSQASKFMEEFKTVSVARKNANNAITEHLDEVAKKGEEATPVQIGSYALSTWKKTLVSTIGTSAVNVKGWLLSRAANSAADMFVAGGLLGRAGVRALVDPVGALSDYTKMKHILHNQIFTFGTLLDPFATSEGFMALLSKATKKAQSRVAGQIFGGVDDFSPSRFGLNPNNKIIKGIERVTDVAQSISFVRLQDVLTKGITGISTLDKEVRFAFGKGVKQLIQDGETWKITDEMWTKVTRQVLEETFSEDLTKGTPIFSEVAKLLEQVSNNPLGGFIVPFGRFMNNTMAFMYRFSPMGLITPISKGLFKGEFDAQGIAKAAVGTSLLWHMMDQEGQKQAEGLQWFERRKEDGSVEDITNLFPYSVYALIGRVAYGVKEGEGVNMQLLEEIKKNIGPLDSLENLAAPPVIKDILTYLSNPSTGEEDVTEFFSIPAALAAATGNILAGYTRPFELVNRIVGYTNPEAGGGIAVDRKQAVEPGDAFLQGLTRNISSFVNLAFGEETEYGTRMYGKPKESATSNGPVRLANPAGTISGTIYSAPAKYINKLLGLVDKPPFRVDSFTSGVPEYDAYVNKEVTPKLEREAERLLNNKVFQKLPKSRQIEEVDKMIKRVKDELVAGVEGGYLGTYNDYLINERRKLLTRDRQARIRAKAALNITTEDHRLTMYQIEAIRRYIDYEKEDSKMLQ